MRDYMPKRELSEDYWTRISTGFTDHERLTCAICFDLAAFDPKRPIAMFDI
jgi:hypothetical protein